jgi:hypothetical protein
MMVILCGGVGMRWRRSAWARSIILRLGRSGREPLEPGVSAMTWRTRGWGELGRSFLLSGMAMTCTNGSRTSGSSCRLRSISAPARAVVAALRRCANAFAVFGESPGELMDPTLAGPVGFVGVGLPSSSRRRFSTSARRRRRPRFSRCSCPSRRSRISSGVRGARCVAFGALTRRPRTIAGTREHASGWPRRMQLSHGIFLLHLILASEGVGAGAGGQRACRVTWTCDKILTCALCRTSTSWRRAG